MVIQQNSTTHLKIEALKHFLKIILTFQNNLQVTYK